MGIASRRTVRFTLALTALGFFGGSLAPKAVSQEAGWVTLFDGKSLDGWDQVGESNWRVEDGAIVVDKMAGKGIIHDNAAGRYKSRLMAKLSA